MKPVKPLDGNMVYKGPTPEIGDLECTRLEPGLIKSQWRLSEEERRFLEAGGLIELQIYTEPIPPISLNVTEPYCPECMIQMEMELTTINPKWKFRCPTCRRWAV